jgi:hypothetical protein
MCTHTHTHTLNVRSLNESNWPDNGSTGAETCCLLYFNKLYVSVVFPKNYMDWSHTKKRGWGNTKGRFTMEYSEKQEERKT